MPEPVLKKGSNEAAVRPAGRPSRLWVAIPAGLTAASSGNNGERSK
jgi:hypothetical protein